MNNFSEEDAREFHSAFIRGLLAFGAIAVFAHACMWIWKPWF